MFVTLNNIPTLAAHFCKYTLYKVTAFCLYKRPLMGGVNKHRQMGEIYFADKTCNFSRNLNNFNKTNISFL